MNFTFNCATDENTNQIIINNVSGLENTGRLSEGMYLYSEAIRVCTKVSDIIDSATLETTQNPIKTGDYDIVFSDLVPYKYQELCESLKDVCQIVNNNGQFVQISFRDEINVSRDGYNGITARKRDSDINIKAFPIQFSPTIDQIEKAGFMERHAVIIWLARCDLIRLNINFDDFDEIRTTVKINGETWKINDKNRVYQMGNDYLYYTLGLGKI